MNTAKETFATKILLWISCAALLALSSPSGKVPFASRVIIALFAAAAFIRLPITTESARKYFAPRNIVIGGLICAAGGWHFYSCWQASNKVCAAVEMLGFSVKMLLSVTSALGAIAAVPFAVYFCGWLFEIFAAYSKKDEKHRATVFIIIAVTLASSLPLFMDGMTYGDDSRFHLLRIESIAQGLLDGSFPVKMNGIINSDYGYPVSAFYGDALLYIPALLRIMGFTIDFAYKAYVLFINLLTAIITYLCFSKIVSQQNALLAMVAYMTASYRYINIYVRSAVGEYTAMMLFPVILLALWKIYNEDGNSNIDKMAVWLLASGMTGLLYIHLLSVEMAVIIIAMVAIIEYKKTFTKNCLCAYIKAVGLTLLLGAGYWIPSVDYYFSCDTAIKQTAGKPKLIQASGTNISNFFAFFRHSKRYNGDGRFQLTPGLVLMCALMLALWLIAVNGKRNKCINKLTGYSIGFLFLASNIFPWDWWAQSNPLGQFMSQIQFPWRYIGVACVVMALLLGCVLENIDRPTDKKNLVDKIIVISCFLMCFHFVSTFEEGASQAKLTTGADWGTSFGAEYVLNGVNINHLPRRVMVTYGKGEIIKEKGVNKDVYVEAPAGATVRFPAFCYPYYEVTDESGNSYDIFEGRNRTIKIKLDEEYSGMLYLRFKEPWYWRAAELVSLAGFVGTVVYIKRKRGTVTTG